MSIHKSFKRSRVKHRTVRKRWERLRSLKLQEKYDKEHSIFGLPKECNYKVKLKKEKKVEKLEVPALLAIPEQKPAKTKKKSKDVTGIR